MLQNNFSRKSVYMYLQNYIRQDHEIKVTSKVHFGEGEQCKLMNKRRLTLLLSYYVFKQL